MTLSPGDIFDRYRIERLLGTGGWGEVYSATDTRLRRRVALKILRQERAAEAPRFLREARAAAAMHHANVVSVFDLGESAGRPFIAMELVEGRLLSELLYAAEVSLEQRIGWLADVARALQASHSAGLLHRDIKPQNVMVTKEGVVKVLDFGLAKQTEASADEGPATVPAFRTAHGRVVGTPRYMAPEALRGEPLDGRADQYAWGVMAFEVLSRGQHPRDGKADAAGVRPARPLNEVVPNAPRALAVVLGRALAADPAERYPDMGVVVGLLDALAAEKAAGAQIKRNLFETMDTEVRPPAALGLAETLEAPAPRPRPAAGIAASSTTESAAWGGPEPRAAAPSVKEAPVVVMAAPRPRAASQPEPASEPPSIPMRGRAPTLLIVLALVLVGVCVAAWIAWRRL